MRKVITYGTFDLLHAGHINLLRRAKELGDYLIVVVSTDEFNWNEKQKKWPVRRIILFAVLVRVDLNESFFLRAAQNTGLHHRVHGLRKERHDVKPHRSASPPAAARG